MSIWFTVSPFCFYFPSLCPLLCLPCSKTFCLFNLDRFDAFLSKWHNMSMTLFIIVLACNTPINNDHCWVLETNGTWISIIFHSVSLHTTLQHDFNWIKEKLIYWFPGWLNIIARFIDTLKTWPLLSHCQSMCCECKHLCWLMNSWAIIFNQDDPNDPTNNMSANN